MKQLIYISILFLTATACSGFLDTAPYNKIATGNMWSTESLADEGVNGIYAVLRNNDVSVTNTSDVTGMDKEGIEGLGFCSVCYNTCNILSQASPSAGDAWISREWKLCYEGVHRSNDAIANLSKAPLSVEKYNRLLCEAKFMRAFFYRRLNMLFGGVPLYLEPINSSEATKGASTAEEIWQACLNDLTACIENEYFPTNTLTSNYGRPSKGAAYAMRGMIYMWMRDFAAAAEDFSKVEGCGYGLWEGRYIDFFKTENEKSKEMILPIQYEAVSGYTDNIQMMLGARDHYDCWTELMPSADFVDYYQNADGSKFYWSKYLPDWDKLSDTQREVFFLRDNLKSQYPEYYSAAAGRVGSVTMTKYYLENGNEARIKAAYESRDPRLQQTVFTPYSSCNCYSPYYNNANPQLGKVLRWPYIERGDDGGDMWHDKRKFAYYIYKKWNETEKGRLVERRYCECDYPLIRYTDVYLQWAEALNETGHTGEAMEMVNVIRDRAGMPHYVSGGTGFLSINGKDDMTEAIRYERRVELCLESQNYFDEIRWGTYKQSKFQGASTSGLKACWGQITVQKWYYKDFMTKWPVPLKEVQMNSNLKMTDGWLY